METGGVDRRIQERGGSASRRAHSSCSDDENAPKRGFATAAAGYSTRAAWIAARGGTTASGASCSKLTHPFQKGSDASPRAQTCGQASRWRISQGTVAGVGAAAVTAWEEGGGCWSATHQCAHLLLVGDEAEGEPLAKLNLERVELADRDPCERICAGATVGGEPSPPIRGEVRARCAGGASPPHCAMNELAWKTSSDDLEARTSAVTSSRCTLWCVRHRDGPPA